LVCSATPLQIGLDAVSRVMLFDFGTGVSESGHRNRSKILDTTRQKSR
jgi:hypothetical protein